MGCTRSGPERTRISSPLVEWHWEYQRAVMESGRVYRLVPRLGAEPRDAVVVDAFVAALDEHGGTDVTDRVMVRECAWPVHDA